jgi:subtilisin family serine protease
MILKLFNIMIGFLAVSVLTLFFSGPAAANNPDGANLAKLGPEVKFTLNQLAQTHSQNSKVRVLVTLTDQAKVAVDQTLDRQARAGAVVRALTAEAAAHPGLDSLLKTRENAGEASDITQLWIVNAFAVNATPALVTELAGRPDVASIHLDAALNGPAPISPFSALPSFSATSSLAVPNAPPSPNLAVINAPKLWALGFTGQNVVIASLDTGVDPTQPDLSAQYRGGTDSWYDPYKQHTGPADLNGHGTWTMGVMVGRSHSQTALGAAPDARWISARIFDDSDTAYTSDIHLAYQWVLAPSGDPAHPAAPAVVNNSWGFSSIGCDLTFQLDLQALRQAGILPVFSAGNAGPAAQSGESPANNPGAFSVGAEDNASVIWSGSSRGPNTCGGSPAIFPRIVAPGVNIFTTGLVRNGMADYVAATGTSLSAPHVTGAVALLLSAFPKMTVAQEEAALTNSAVHLGTPSPNNDYGSGGLDVYAAYQYMVRVTGSPAPPAALPDHTFLPILSH